MGFMVGASGLRASLDKRILNAPRQRRFARIVKENRREPAIAFPGVTAYCCAAQR
jgi:hypothetical protein